MVEEEWQGVRTEISEGSVVLIPAPSLQVVHWMGKENEQKNRHLSSNHVLVVLTAFVLWAYFWPHSCKD